LPSVKLKYGDWKWTKFYRKIPTRGTAAGWGFENKVRRNILHEIENENQY